MSSMGLHLAHEVRDDTDCGCPDCVSMGAWSYAHGHDYPSCRWATDARRARRAMAACPRCVDA